MEDHNHPLYSLAFEKDKHHKQRQAIGNHHKKLSVNLIVKRANLKGVAESRTIWTKGNAKHSNKNTARVLKLNSVGTPSSDFKTQMGEPK